MFEKNEMINLNHILFFRPIKFLNFPDDLIGYKTN